MRRKYIDTLKEGMKITFRASNEMNGKVATFVRWRDESRRELIFEYQGRKCVTRYEYVVLIDKPITAESK